MRSFIKVLFVAALAVLATGCSDYRTIPVGYVGKVVSNTGVSKETFKPGTRNIGWNARFTNKLVLLDTSVDTSVETLTIRLADSQELTVSVLVKTQIDTSNPKRTDGMFGLITPEAINKHNAKITLTRVYSKLGADLVNRSMVEVFTPLSLESFQETRKTVNDTLEGIIRDRFSSTPLKLYSASITKVVYPQTYINKSNQIKDEEMSVELVTATEKAKREKLKEQEATIKIDQRVRLAKAETIRLENLKTSQGLNPMLLEYRKMELEELRLEVDMEMAKAASVNGNSVIYYPIGQRPNYVETRMGQTN